MIDGVEWFGVQRLLMTAPSTPILLFKASLFSVGFPFVSGDTGNVVDEAEGFIYSTGHCGMTNNPSAHRSRDLREGHQQRHCVGERKFQNRETLRLPPLLLDATRLGISKKSQVGWDLIETFGRRGFHGDGERVPMRGRGVIAKP